MKTDELVALLSTNPEPVDRGLVVRTLLVALGAGSILALGITIFGLGVRPDMVTSGALGFVATKVSFAVGIFSLALVYLAKLARWRGAKTSIVSRCGAVSCHRGACSNQPRAGAKLALDQDDHRRRMARMPCFHSGHRDRSFRRRYLGRSTGGAYEPCSHGCFRGTCCGRR